MRLGGMIAAALLGNAFSDYANIRGSDWDLMGWSASNSAQKPNRVSQAKRRKYARQGRK